MAFDLWIAFVVSTAVIIAIPGPTVMLVISHALAHGSLLAMGTVSAIAFADIILIALSYMGIAALLNTSAIAFNVLKICGAGYLIYIGVRLFRAQGAVRIIENRTSSALRLAREGFFSTLLNPKSFIFVISFFPQFMRPGGSSLMQISILTATFLTVAVAVISVYVVLAGRIGDRFRTGEGLLNLNRIAGGMLMLTGLVALIADRV
jgi:threonine/homoserine/homoserine lactone efflux protein